MKRTKRWIFFYEYSDKESKYIEAVGGDSVLPVDNRLSNETIEFRVTHRYYPIPKRAVAFAIHSGDRLINADRITNIKLLINKHNIED